ncbi:hypothetical protein A6R68_21860, partial [Neotoma lepida]
MKKSSSDKSSEGPSAIVMSTVCVYINKHGDCGPYLDPQKVQQLPDHFGPGPVNVILRRTVQACVDCAIDSKAEIDGKALLLLKSELMMKYMGLKLGPALKLCYYIEKLKESFSTELGETALLRSRRSLPVRLELV